MKRTLWALAAMLACASPALAQNPCASPNANTILSVTGTNRFYAELPEHTAVRPDGTPVVVAYQFAAWTDVTDPNVSAPVQGPTTIPKTAFTAVPGASGCYELIGGLPGLIPQQQRMAVSMRAQSQPGAPAPFSSWSTLSNSFSSASTPLTPAVPGRLRIQP